jgi:hypothetical protein
MATLPRLPARCHGLLDSVSWKGVAAVGAFALALSAWTWSGVLLSGKTLNFDEQMEYFLSLVQRNLLTYVPIYLAVAIADRLPLQGRTRRVALGAALLGAVLLSVQLRCAAMPDMTFWVYHSINLKFCTAFPTWQAYIDFPSTVITPLATGAMVMVFVFGRRHDCELRAALHGARAAQLVSHRQRLESDLEAMQSRVDPDQLFRTLAAIRERYESSAAAGDAMLDELIQGLRTAARRPESGAAA